MSEFNDKNLDVLSENVVSVKGKEWTCSYNPFNSMKVLLWREHLEAIAKNKFLPPVTVDTDPTNVCNYNCVWCNSQDFREKKPASMPTEHLLKLADFYKEWGVYSTCVAGGGEPLLHPGFSQFVKRLAKNKVESGIITNGSMMNEEHIETIADYSRWCGFSMDAGTSATYIKLKGIKDEKIFFLVLKNIEKLAKAKRKYKSNLRIAYKFLMHPDNCLEIYKAADIARSLGVNDFHLRPVGWDNLYSTQNRDKLNFAPVLKDAKAQISAAQELETKDFHVYGVTHKFGEKWERKINFKKCLATPLLATFGADGMCHLCFDMRGREDLLLCSHYPEPREILKVWGSDFHRKMIDKINPKECPRCTFGAYNEAIEQVIINDEMCRYFP